MFKFKMSLLVKNAKFRTALIVLLIASIVAGIIYIPRNKASKTSTKSAKYSMNSSDVITKSLQLAGKKYYGGESSNKNGKGYDGNLWDAKSSYNSKKLLSASKIEGVDCSGLVWWTLASVMKDKSITKGTTGFAYSNPIPVDVNHWLFTNANCSNYVTKSSKLYFNGEQIKILKANEKITKELRYYQYKDSDGKIVDLPEGTIIVSNGSQVAGKEYQNHAWIYLGNFETSKPEEVQKILKSKYNVDVNINSIKSLGNNTHWKIEATAKEGVTVNNGDPNTGDHDTANDVKDAKKRKAVGNIWAYQFVNNEIPSGEYSIELVKVKEDGTTVITTSEATFDINGTSTDTKSGVLSIASNKKVEDENQKDSYTIVETKAPEGYDKFEGTLKLDVAFKLDTATNKYVIDTENTKGTGFQDKTRFEVTNNNTKIKVYVPNTETPEGTYSVELVKVKEDGTTVITTSEATFDINGESKDTTKGLLTVASSKKIENEEQKDSYAIKETKAPEGYNKFEGTLNLDVAFKLDETTNKYVIDTENTKGTGFNDKTRFEFANNNTKIKVFVVNTEKPQGTYSVELVKVKEDGTTVITTSEATFDVNGEAKNTTSGLLTLASNKKIENEEQKDSYTVVETKAPEGYDKFEGTLKLDVAFKLDTASNKYVIDTENTKGTGFQDKTRFEVTDNNTKIKVFVVNTPTPEGAYSIELVKVKEDGTTVITASEATFNVNGEAKNTTKGLLTVVSNKKIENEKQKDEYTVVETKAPEGYDRFEGTLKLDVAFKLDTATNKYVIDTENTKGTGFKDKTRFEVTDNNTKIKVFVVNTETPEGTYSVELVKVKEDGTTVITTSEATFDINGTSKKTAAGLLTIASSKKIENEKQKDTYTIVETESPEGYDKFEGTLKLDVAFKLDTATNRYVIDTENTKGTGFKDKTRFEVADNTKIKVFVVNTPTPKGEYTVELYKTDEQGNIIKTPAVFTINGAEETTKDGKLTVIEKRVVSNVNITDSYEIKEKEAPTNYSIFDGIVTLKVKMERVGDKVVLNPNGITFDVEGDKSKARFELDGTTVKVYVKNTKKSFDLALRKFISKVNGENVKPSREIVIDTESIKNLELTGTAIYHHTKDSVLVNVGDLVEYTIRVYNEGEILGYSKQITDYLPEGLTFVKLSDDNSKEYTTTTEAGSRVVVIDYSGNTNIKSLRDFINKKEVNVNHEYYQEVKIICKVENTNVTYITNRGEITNYGYEEKDENGNVVWVEANKVNVDRDSVEGTIISNLDLDNWYVKAQKYTYTDSEGKKVTVNDYYPGVEDDDDFETVQVMKGIYSVVIRKVDSSNKNNGLAGAYFNVKLNKDFEVGPTNAEGYVDVVKDEALSLNNKVEFTITEKTAPEGYNKYDKEIKVEMLAKVNNGKYVIDTEKTKLVNKDNKVTMDVNVEKSLITITIPNDKKEFDLALRKFITEVNGEKTEKSREPVVDTTALAKGETTTATYTHPKNALYVNTTDIVTYTLRVYNEGEIDGYAAEVIDDVPQGTLMVAPSYDEEGKPTNKNAEYRWKMYREATDKEKTSDKQVAMLKYDDKLYVETKKAEEAVLIATDYLSKEQGEARKSAEDTENPNLIKAFDGKKLDSKDIKVEFKVTEKKVSDKVITNYAQIAKNTNKKGEVVTDRDSTPNKWVEGEDDQDIENIKIRYFDLSLIKYVSKAIVYENGEKRVIETGHTGYENPEPVVKVDLQKANLNDVTVKFEYTIKVTNDGEKGYAVAGYAKEISDYIPEGLKFLPEDNKNWKEVDGKIVTDALKDKLLEPGESAEVTVILTWINDENNMGLKVNTAEISKDYNKYGIPDRDSTPNNRVEGEDDIDTAPVMLTVRTGMPKQYIGVGLGVLVIITAGLVLIKKKVIA